MELFKADILQAVILTKNEEPNIKRVLDRLGCFEKIIILDSFSTDQTIAIVNAYPNTEVHSRVFDTHAMQWNYGLELARSEWILSLDADYVLTDDFIREIKDKLTEGRTAYFSKFKFLVFGKTLVRDNTQPRPVLFKKADCIYFDDGHTQRLEIKGDTGNFTHPILHDDRKSLSRWLSNQDKYSIRECAKLNDNAGESKSVTDRIRRTKVLAPFLVFFYCLFIQGLIFNGWRGWYYTLQRTMVEMLFALRLIEEEELKQELPKITNQ